MECCTIFLCILSRVKYAIRGICGPGFPDCVTMVNGDIFRYFLKGRSESIRNSMRTKDCWCCPMNNCDWLDEALHRRVLEPMYSPCGCHCFSSAVYCCCSSSAVYCCCYASTLLLFVDFFCLRFSVARFL